MPPGIVRFVASVFALMLMMGGAPGPAWGQASGEFAVFNAHDPKSPRRIDYTYWTKFLRATVLVTGPSNRFTVSSDPKLTGTNLHIHNPQRSWMEGNRVFFNLLDDTEIKKIAAYKAELEALPDVADYKSFNRNEQLAYWLNLYTVSVYLEVSNAYPRVQLKGFYEGGRKSEGLWKKKIVNVMGVSLSLEEIREEIIIPIWRNPLVLYGLYHGSVGGPNIRRSAYSGERVWAMLESNAREFINSIRGIHLAVGGRKTYVSKIYDWGKSAFPGGEEAVFKHMGLYADAKTGDILQATGNVSISYFDWHIADLYNGKPNWFPAYAVNSVNGNGPINPASHPVARRFFNTLMLRYRKHGWPSGTVTVEELPRVEGTSDEEN